MDLQKQLQHDKDDEKNLYKIFWNKYNSIKSHAPAYGVKDLSLQPTTAYSYTGSIGVNETIRKGKTATFEYNYDKLN